MLFENLGDEQETVDQMSDLHQSRWHIDPTKLPGPNRDHILYVHDQVFESPAGKLAAVVYSIQEVLNNWYVGLLAVFAGEPTNPQVLFRPDNFVCTPAVRWLCSERQSVQMSMYRNASKGYDLPFCLIDLDLQLFTMYPFKNPCASIECEEGRWIVREWERHHNFHPHDGKIVRPEQLRWFSWTELDHRQERYFGGVFGKAE